MSGSTVMSPTVFRAGPYRFFFFSREEDRVHVHVSSSRGEAKFWVEPIVALAENYGLGMRDLSRIHRILEDRRDEIIRRWKTHFKS